MPARLTAYLPDDAAPTTLLGDGEVLRIGRDERCGLRVAHPSISRAHAELQRRDGGWQLRDLGSKNGTHLDGVGIDHAALERDCWLRLGDIYCEFTVLGEAAAAADEDRRRLRRTRATALTAGLAQVPDLDRLLDGTLQAAVELAHCRRGFLLLRDGDDYAVRVQRNLDAREFGASRFAGSVGAVQRALAQRRSVVVNDVGSEPWLAQRASVIAGGLSALVCLPLFDGAQPSAAEPLGLIYADRDGPGDPVTALDLELLQAFCERAALYLSAQRDGDARAVADAGGWQRIVGLHAASP